MEVLIQELKTKDTTSSNNVSVGFVQSNRGRGQARGYHGGYRGTFIPRGGFRPRGRGPPPTYRPPAPGSRQPSCQICLEARKYDSALGHTAQTCPFKNELRNITRQQQTPNFKVLLVPQPATLPQPSASTGHVSSVHTSTPAQGENHYYDYQHADPYVSSNYPDQYPYEDQFYTDPFTHYEPATIEEVSGPGAQQDL